ncbi:hypothetical protein [Rhizobium leguminosarum]|uniref:hypothetical protein n=1 Tax=Rhizobium leguminosarum TaxID=384 RepID=UPI0014421348|nr:hypothetical protein [Rhizobium leguminosarum]NKL63291.1 hypothetical protein [Rhizobium leguminosarum bv. viciae]
MSKTPSLLPLTSFVQKHIRSALDGRPLTVTYDVRGRWDVDSENGVVIGSTTPVDVSYCFVDTDVTWTPPTT